MAVRPTPVRLLTEAIAMRERIQSMLFAGRAVLVVNPCRANVNETALNREPFCSEALGQWLVGDRADHLSIG